MGLFGKLFERRHEGAQPEPKKARSSSPPSLSCSNLQGIGERERQEDSFALRGATDRAERERRGLLAVVCDGMGGMVDGSLAGEFAVETLLNRYEHWEQASGVPAFLMDAVTAANETVFQQLSGRGGTTLAAVHILGEAMHWISVGDSGLFLYRNGGVFQINCEHTYRNQLYAEELRAERIDRRRVETDPDAPRLSSFVGINRLELVDRSRTPFHIERGDAILLCSDGVSGILTPADFAEAMALPPEDGCRLLETMVREKAVPGQDNYTGILIAYR